MLKYEKATTKDTQTIANLHKVGIPTGFLSKQSISFLEALYAYLIEHEIVYIAKEDDKIVGFIATSKNTTGLYKRFLKNNLPMLIKFALKNIFSIEFIKKAYETLNAPKKTKIVDDDYNIPELLSIVVDKNYYKMGIAKNLLKCIEDNLCNEGFSKYKVVVGAKLEANKFYKKSGFEVVSEIELHEGDKSYIYIKKIGDKNGK